MKITDWLYSTFVDGFFNKLLTECLNFALNFFTELLLEFSEIDRYFQYKSVLSIIQVIAGVFLTYAVMFQGFKRLTGNYIFDGDSKPMSTIILQTSFAGMLIYLLPFILTVIILPCSKYITLAITSQGVALTNIPNEINAFSSGLTSHFGIIGALISMLVLCISFIILGVMAGIRHIELLIALLISPIVAIQFVGKQDTIGLWAKEVISICLTQTIHIFIVQLMMALFMNKYINPFITLSLFIGLIAVAVKGASILKQYMYSTGTGSALVGASGSATQMVTMRYLVGK